MQNKSLEEQSFENAVWFYQVELRRIMRGHPALAILGYSRSTSFHRHGVLARVKKPGSNQNITVVSEKAQKILEKGA